MYLVPCIVYGMVIYGRIHTSQIKKFYEDHRLPIGLNSTEIISEYASELDEGYAVHYVYGFLINSTTESNLTISSEYQDIMKLFADQYKGYPEFIAAIDGDYQHQSEFLSQ